MQYVSGDLFTHVTPNMVIAHVVNDAGGWGAGFTGPLGTYYPLAKQRYREWAAGKRSAPFSLGRIQVVTVWPEQRIFVCNMLAQHGYRTPTNPVPACLDDIEVCLSKLHGWTTQHHLTVIMPLIGSGLGGLCWVDVEPVVERTLPDCIIVRR